MKKLIIALLLISVLFMPNLSASITNRFPVVKKGNYFIYNKTESGKLSTLGWQAIEWTYNITNVYDNGTVIMRVSWKKGDEEGGYTTKIYATNLLYFKIFFDITNLSRAITQLMNQFGNYTIEEIKYEWKGNYYSCINASYNMTERKGYFIISKDYGVMFERVQLMFDENITAQGILGSSIMRLTDTNAFGKAEIIIYVIIIMIIAIPITWLLWKKGYISKTALLVSSTIGGERTIA